MNFCRLPPDRLARRGVGPAALHVERGDRRARRTRAPRRVRMKPRCTMPCAMRGQQRVLGERHLGHGAAAEPLLGHEGEAERAALRRRRAGPPALPHERAPRRRRRAVRSPDSAASSSFWPLPETPAMPTISPARTVRRIVARATCRTDRPARSDERVARRARRRPACASRWRGCGRSPPIIMRASDADVSCRGSHVPVTRPRAQHRRAVAQRADLVELVADVEDAAAFRRRAGAASRTASRTACGVSTDVGSSMISSRGSCSRQRTISTRCRSPTDIVCTWRRGSSGRP